MKTGDFVFMGEYRPALDEKGRLAIPAKLRRAYGEELTSLVLAPGYDRCVMGFRPADWSTFVNEKLAPLPQADPAHRKRVRFLLGGAHECELDRQGRVLIPAPLLDYAGLKHECVVIGVNERLEIWNAGAWRDYLPADADLEKFAAELGI